jgi:uncharacterized protein
VKEISDLQPGMTLEGVVTNVTKFGAFVDIGVHQDGLVHISELSDRFVQDPNEAVKVGQIVKVHVLSADAKAKRIALSMKTQGAPAQRPRADGPRPLQQQPSRGPQNRPAQQNRPPKPETKPQPTLEDKISQLANRWKSR